MTQHLAPMGNNRIGMVISIGNFEDADRADVKISQKTPLREAIEQIARELQTKGQMAA